MLVTIFYTGDDGKHGNVTETRKPHESSEQALARICFEDERLPFGFTVDAAIIHENPLMGCTTIPAEKVVEILAKYGNGMNV